MLTLVCHAAKDLQLHPKCFPSIFLLFFLERIPPVYKLHPEHITDKESLFSQKGQSLKY